MTRLFLLIAFLAFAATAALAHAGPEKLADPAQEARAIALQKEFRCLVCQGESLDESGAPLAADLRRLIRAHIQAGDTNAQIERYLVARYGEFILMKPPLEPRTYALWFGPAFILMVGGMAAAAVIFRARKNA